MATKSTRKRTTGRKRTSAAAKSNTRKSTARVNGTAPTKADAQKHVVAKLEEALKAAKSKKYRTVRSCIDSARRVAMAQPEYQKETR